MADLQSILEKISSHQGNRLVTQKQIDDLREELVRILCHKQAKDAANRAMLPPTPPTISSAASGVRPPYVHSPKQLLSADSKPASAVKVAPARKSHLSSGLQMEPAHEVNSMFDSHNLHLRLGLCNIETLPKRFPAVMYSPRQHQQNPVVFNTRYQHRPERKTAVDNSNCNQPFSAAIAPPPGKFRGKIDEMVLHSAYTAYTAAPVKLPAVEKCYTSGPPRTAAYI